MFRADALYRMRDQLAGETQKARHVRQLGVRIEGGFVYPLRVNVENQRVARRLVEMNEDAAGLSARWL